MFKKKYIFHKQIIYTYIHLNKSRIFGTIEGY